MRLGLAIALLCTAGATSMSALANTDDLDLPGLDAADMRGDAMVWEDAPLYLEPWDGGAFVKFNYISRRREEPGRAMPVRIVDSTMRNFVEVTLPGRADCSWRRIDLDNRIEGLRLFVRRSDLAPVLVKPYAAQYPDGTRIKLGVGVPITPVANGEYMVGLRNLEKIRLPIPHASVGYLYKLPGKIIDPELPKDKVVRIDRVTLKIGPESFQVRSNWYSAVPEKKPDTTLVKLGMRCIEMVVSAPSTSLRTMEPPRPYVTATPASPNPAGWRIPAGAPLMTSSGREVAVAAKDIAVTMPSPAPDTVCFETRISMIREDETYGTSYKSIRLCASGNVVEK